LEDPLSEKLLRGDFQGKDVITVKVEEVDGEKRLGFEATSTQPQPELVGAGAERAKS
jgi:ATP-dependent Clp protease ATP-binding subunit ClpC